MNAGTGKGFSLFLCGFKTVKDLSKWAKYTKYNILLLHSVLLTAAKAVNLAALGLVQYLHLIGFTTAKNVNSFEIDEYAFTIMNIGGSLDRCVYGQFKNKVIHLCLCD